jgi:hypothetical protein
MMRWCVLLAVAGVAWAASRNVKELQLEYRPTDSGYKVAVIHNQHPAAATAYIAEAYFQNGGRDRRSAFGGDSMSYADGGGLEVAASSDKTTGQTLPRNASPDSTGFVAAIYADGFTEGDEDVVSMVLSGRQRSYKDLKECLPALERAARGEMPVEALTHVFEQMQTRDTAEAAKLDDMVAFSGMKYRFFMTAVPQQALQMLQGGDAAAARAMLEPFRAWMKRLDESQPSIMK